MPAIKREPRSDDDEETKRSRPRTRTLFAPSAPAATGAQAVATEGSVEEAVAAVKTEEQADLAPTTPTKRRTTARSLVSAAANLEQQASPSIASPQRRYALRLRAHASTSKHEPTPAALEEQLADEQEEEDKKATQTAKQASFFNPSPRKKALKPLKRELEAHEAHPPPKRWQETYAALLRQRRRIVAPVDTMGCEEAGEDSRRGDLWRVEGIKTEVLGGDDGAGETAKVESEEDAARRRRFTTLVSLMLSSQTKDPVTAAAVANLQRELPGGLTVDSLLAASDEQVSACINKVGFWRRKTGYIKSAARIIKDDFNGDIPKDIDDIISLPGVGPKMAYLLLQSAWSLNEGIGVDVHVHRITNRLGWHRKPTTTAEQTRLNLQSWLPKELHGEINRVLVGFGQVICLPVSPRCDLCALSTAKLCPSRRKVDPKSVESRVKVEFLAEDGEGNVVDPFPHKFRYEW